MQRIMAALEQQGPRALLSSQPLQWLATYTNAGALSAITIVCVLVSIPSIITLPYACCVCWVLGRWALGRGGGGGGVHSAWVLQTYAGVHVTVLYMWQLPLPWERMGGVVDAAAVLGLYHVGGGGVGVGQVVLQVCMCSIWSVVIFVVLFTHCMLIVHSYVHTHSLGPIHSLGAPLPRTTSPVPPTPHRYGNCAAWWCCTARWVQCGILCMHHCSKLCKH